jgi:hypothetical protein
MLGNCYIKGFGPTLHFAAALSEMLDVITSHAFAIKE